MDFRRDKSLPSIMHFVFQEPTHQLSRQQRASPRTFSQPGVASGLLGLTYEIRQQDGQEQGRGDGRQGGAFPAAVFGGFLQLEGLPGEGIPGQQAGWWRVNGS